MIALSPCVDVVARQAGGEVARLSLAHGQDPGELLASRGWQVRQEAGLAVACRAELAAGAHWGFEFVFEVAPVQPAEALGAQVRVVPRDPGLGSADVIGVRPYRRVAAYAVVQSARGVLLTELSSLTNAPGSWTLPGGGLNQLEMVRDGLIREVWEETGAGLGEPTLLGVQSSHWVGRAPNGGVEDYHAIRIVHRASCPDPQEPVIHDVGGSTSDARWVAWDQLASVPIVPSFAPVLHQIAQQHQTAQERHGATN